MRHPDLRTLWVIGLSLLMSHAALAQGGPPRGPAGPAQVGTVEIQTEGVPYIRTLPGRAVAYERTEIRPRVGGMIEEVYYRPGTMLAVGDPMYRIEDTPYRAAVASARASVAGAEVEFANAKATAERYRALQGRAASATDLQAAELSVAKSAAALAAAQAALETAELNLANTRITSPIAGVAGVSLESVGALVTANQAQALTTVTRLDPIYVDVSDSSAGMLRTRDRVASGQLLPGDRIGLRLLLETGTPYDREGELVTVGTDVKSSTGTVDMRIQFENPDRLILPGQFLRVEATLGTIQATLVPQRATTRGSNGALFAWIVQDGKARRVQLETSGTHNNSWITTAGVNPGDRLIVDGISNLSEGAEVKPLDVVIDKAGVVRDAAATQAAGN